MKRLSYLLIVILVGLQLAATLPVAACSGDFRKTEPQEHIDDADLVLVGTVIGSSSSDAYTAHYAIQVESYLKGSGPDAILITGYGYAGGDCRNYIAVGQRWIFRVDGDPKSDEVLQASYLQVYDSVQEASDENIALASTLTGQPPTPPYATPIWTLIKYWTYSPIFKVATLVGIPGLVLAIGLSIAMKRRHPTKKKNG